MLRIAPTNACVSVALESDDYSSKASINDAAQREPDLSAIRWNDLIPYISISFILNLCSVFIIVSFTTHHCLFTVELIQSLPFCQFPLFLE